MPTEQLESEDSNEPRQNDIPSGIPEISGGLNSESYNRKIEDAVESVSQEILEPSNMGLTESVLTPNSTNENDPQETLETSDTGSLELNLATHYTNETDSQEISETSNTTSTCTEENIYLGDMKDGIMYLDFSYQFCTFNKSNIQNEITRY